MEDGGWDRILKQKKKIAGIRGRLLGKVTALLGHDITAGTWAGTGKGTGLLRQGTGLLGQGIQMQGHGTQLLGQEAGLLGQLGNRTARRRPIMLRQKKGC